MKKINKTVLLASTLFISSAINITDKSYASEDYKDSVKPSYGSLDEAELEKAYESKSVSEIEAHYRVDYEDNQKDPEENHQSNQESLGRDQEAELDSNSNIEEGIDYDFERTQSQETDEKSLSKPELENKETNKNQERKIIYYDSTNLDAQIEKEEGKKDEQVLENEEINVENNEYYAPNASGYFVKKNNRLNYYENNKLVKNRSIRVDNRIYKADKTGAVTNPTNTWLKVGSDIYYNKEDGTYTKGISTINNNQYFFSNDGVLQRNKKLISNGSYYEVNNTGRMTKPANKWVKINNGVYRTLNDGSLAKGVTNINDKDYMFDNNGLLQTNKKMLVNGKYYEVNRIGQVTNPKNTWISLRGETYWTGNNGTIAKGPASINGNEYVFDNKTGVMLTNTETITNGRYFRVNAKGVSENPKNSWITYKGNKYHTNNQGYVKEGIWRIDGTLYYFTNNGLAKNTKVIQQGIEYQVDGNGVATAIANRIAGEKSIDKAIEWMFVARENKMTYDMGAKRNTTEAADCSSAVYRSLIYGGFLDQNAYVGNTETLFRMGETGVIMKEISESEIDYGDIFVAGRPGESLGAGGHTGFILNKAEDTIIHMNYGRNGVSVTPRIGNIGDKSGLPVKYYRLIGAKSDKKFLYKK